MQRVANFGDSFRLGWIVAITRAPDESITGADCKHDLGEIGRERDNPVHSLWQRYTTASVVCNLTRILNCSRMRSVARTKEYQRGDQRQPLDQLFFNLSHPHAW